MKELQSIQLSKNFLEGTILSSLGGLDKLQVINFECMILLFIISLNSFLMIILLDNQLSGTIPDSLLQMENLQVLELNANQLTGNIPDLQEARSLQQLG